MDITTENLDINKLICWLEKRIKTTKGELNLSESLELQIGKGAKLTAYKECLNYIKEYQK